MRPVESLCVQPVLRCSRVLERPGRRDSLWRVGSWWGCEESFAVGWGGGSDAWSGGDLGTDARLGAWLACCGVHEHRHDTRGTVGAGVVCTDRQAIS